MMHLNSIWLEGNLITSPQFIKQGEAFLSCGFQVASTRIFRGEKEISIFHVELRNPELLDELENLERGQGIRIIGRLTENRALSSKEEKESSISIVAEMVERRPRFSLCGKSFAGPIPRRRAAAPQRIPL